MRGIRIIGAVAVAVVAARANGQDRLWSVDGPKTGAWLGRQVCAIGDMNGDGRCDVAATAPYAALGGILRVLDGATGATLLDVLPGAFGSYPSARRFADVDGDGVEEVFLWRFVGSVVKASVVSLSPKSVHYDVGGYDDPIAVGDVDQDGVQDFAVMAPSSASLSEVRVKSGSSGALVLTLAPAGRSSGFGDAMASAGDWDGDGVPDLAVVDKNSTPPVGDLTIFSLSNGAQLLAVDGPKPAGSNGKTFDQVGDVDGDGIVDFVWSDTSESVGANVHAGAVHLLSGATLAQIGQWSGTKNDEYLHLVEAAGDVNGDGKGDFAVSSGDQYKLDPVVWYLSGRTCSRLYAIQNENVDDWTRVGRGADFDGDGIDDFLSGRPLASSSTLAKAGRVAVDRGRRTFLSATPAVRDRFAVSGPARSVRNFTFDFHLAEFRTGTTIDLQLVEVDGSATSVPLGSGVADALGEWDKAVVLAPPDPNTHVYGVQAYGTNFAGQAVMTTIERVAYR